MLFSQSNHLHVKMGELQEVTREAERWFTCETQTAAFHYFNLLMLMQLPQYLLPFVPREGLYHVLDLCLRIFYLIGLDNILIPSHP